MRLRRRYLAAQVERDLRRKMVFVAGPRQVGKTTLARSLPGASAGYLNWDVPEGRDRILRRELHPGPFWVFDEIHKYRAWRALLKGLWDGRRPGQRILVTGSASRASTSTGTAGTRSRADTTCSGCTPSPRRSWGSSRPTNCASC